MAGLDAPFLFPCDTDSKRPVPKVNNAHDRAVKASKVAKFRLYDLRHTWATRAAESGIDLVTLAALLGHSKIQMVLRYAHPTQEHQTRSVERMEQFVAAKQMEALSLQQRAAGGRFSEKRQAVATVSATVPFSTLSPEWSKGINILD